MDEKNRLAESNCPHESLMLVVQVAAERELNEMKRALDAGQRAHSLARDEHARERSR